MQSQSSSFSDFSSTHARAFIAEGLGSLLLVAVVVGSGIMAERLAGGSAGLALLANTAATVLGLFALITTFGHISGAHFNPVVTMVEVVQGRMVSTRAIGYLSMQILGAVAGVMLANVMFGEPVVALSRHERSGLSMALSEFVATFGLIATIRGAGRASPGSVPFAVASWIGAAYWFTPSTSFANPAVTMARCLTDTFAGIRPLDMLPFLVAQVTGALAASSLFGWIAPDREGDRSQLRM